MSTTVENYALAAMQAGVKEQNLNNAYQMSDGNAAAQLGKDSTAASDFLYNNPQSSIQEDLANIANEVAIVSNPNSSQSEITAAQEAITSDNAQYGADSAAASNVVNNDQTNVVGPMTTESQQDSSNVANSGQFVSSVLSTMSTLTTLLSQALI